MGAVSSCLGRFQLQAFVTFSYACQDFFWLTEFLVYKLRQVVAIPQAYATVCLNLAGVGLMAHYFFIYPLAFKNLAQLIGFFVVSTKVLAVLVHTPEVKKVSMQVSFFETSMESSGQLCLLLNVWMQGGPLYISPILSSILVIGKTNAENYLSDSPENRLKGKSFLEKLKLVLCHLPLFCSTIFFRVGSGPIKVINHFAGVLSSYRMSYIIYLNAIHFWVTSPILICILRFFLKFVFPQLKDMSTVGLWQVVIGELTCPVPYPSLGRIKARGPQFVMASWYFLSNLVYIYFLHNTHGLQKRVGATVYCYLLYSSAFISYILTILHFYVFPLDRELINNDEPASNSQDQELEAQNQN